MDRFPPLAATDVQAEKSTHFFLSNDDEAEPI
jgi:hypothetical protein